MLQPKPSPDVARPITTVRFNGFSIITPRVLEWGEVEGVLYLTDGKQTWEFREVLPMSGPKSN